MTSRQPETMPPGTADYAAIPGDRGMRGDRGTAVAGHRRVSAARWPVLVLPLTLLIIVAMAGLRGEVTGLRWDGPLRGAAVAVGLALELVLGILLVITIRLITAQRPAARARAGRVGAAPASAVAVKLRRVLVFVLGAGMIAVAVTMIAGVHHHVFSGPAGAQPGQGQATRPASSSPATRPGRPFILHLHLHVTGPWLYALAVLLLLGGAVLFVWVRRNRPSGLPRAYHYLGRDSEDLREAVEAGQSALRAVDDVRAAIIACYVAMEASLAEHGTARAVADTPDELLTRATAAGIVRGTAAARLTALFYEARFSSHPMDGGHRDAAARALGELAAALAEADAARTRVSRSRATRSRANRSRPERGGAERSGARS
jgi:hypothetical protein